MNRYRQQFPGQHTVLPVIHVATLEQTLRNVEIAREAAADGIFLINHDISDAVLLEIYAQVAEAHPGWWIGVNCLQMTAAHIFTAIPTTICGIWTDNAGIEEHQQQQPFAEEVQAIHQQRVPDCLYFGGVAFKYQRQVADLEAACRIAPTYMDVVTTSGPGTGHAADVIKIRRMKEALGDTPLAIASGITPENVVAYLPYADSFLVATGISIGFTELDPVRVRQLVGRVQGRM